VKIPLSYIVSSRFRIKGRDDKSALSYEPGSFYNRNIQYKTGLIHSYICWCLFNVHYPDYGLRTNTRYQRTYLRSWSSW